MKAQDRIKQAHADILRHPKWCAVSGLLACGKSEIDDSVPTACTDGWNRRYNAAFVESLTREELRFVVLHEVAGHMAYQHMQTWRALWQKNARLTNISADHFVNLALMDSDAGEGFIRMPEQGIQPEARFRGMHVGQIYKILEGEPQQQQGFDDHDWEDAPSEETSKVRTLEIDRAMRQGEILRRQRGNKDATPFGELLSAKVDWKQQLRDFLSTGAGHDESTWSRVSRRHMASGDTYMPGTYGVRMGEVVLGVDTSGSCVGEEMTEFISELRGLVGELKPEKVHVVYWDTSVTGHQMYEGEFDVHDLKPTGGGGTDGSVLFDYLREKGINPQCVVQFSDGCVNEWGHSDWPTLWALTTSRVSPHGTTVRIGS